MPRDILVTIVCNDVYSRNWMSLLLVRDWRTRVVSELSLQENLSLAFNQMIPKPDLLLVDLDANLEDPGLASELITLSQRKVHPKIILISSRPEIKFFRHINGLMLDGYLLKNEISTSLAWALTFASEGRFVLTPQAEETLFQSSIDLPANKMILRGRSFPGLTDRQEEIARLAIIFSIGRRDLADELKISDQWSYSIVSELYTKMGLEDIFSGEIDPYQYLQDDPVIRSHIEEIINELGDSKKARDLETLAFHLLTLPTIEE